MGTPICCSRECILAQSLLKTCEKQLVLPSKVERDYTIWPSHSIKYMLLGRFDTCVLEGRYLNVYSSNICIRKNTGNTEMFIFFFQSAKLFLNLFNPMDSSTPGFPVLLYLPEFAQTHVHWVGDVIQPPHSSVAPFSSRPQSFPAPGSFLMSQFFALGDQVLELQLQHQSFQWIFRVDFL